MTLAQANRRTTTGAAERVGTEQELKFIAGPKVFRAALALPLLGEGADAPTWARLTSTYFDTDDGDLMRRGLALRLRRKNGGYVLGLKGAAPADGLFRRDEIETPSPSPEPDPALFGAAIAYEIKAIAGEKPLKPKFGSDIRRATRMVTFDGAAVEVAFDRGFLFAGERREPMREIELELKSGEPAALFRLGLSLVDALPLRLGVSSKAERAAALLSAAPPEPTRAKSPAIAPDMPIDEAIAVILRNCLSHFLGNLPALEAGDAVEAVHQMRVAMRRLRSALGLFNRLCPCPRFDALQAESKRIATTLGQARDWDVLVEMLLAGPISHLGGEPGFDRLLAAARAKAEAGQAAVKKLADGQAVTRLALLLEQVATAREWRSAAGEKLLQDLDEPVGEFAARSLDRLDRRLRKRGRHFRKLSPEARHKLRIAMKHMRYATEFFDSLFAGSAAERYARKAGKLQDLLGELNDATVGSRLIKELGFGADPNFAFAAGVAAGWCARASLGDEAALKKAWRALLKADRYWRRQAAKPELKQV